MTVLDDIYQGDGFRFDVPIRAGGRLPEGDIAEWKFWFTVKASAAQTDAQALFQLTSAAGDITIFDAANWIVRIRGRAVHTKDKTPGRYVFDFQVQAPGEDPETTDSGPFILRPQITRAE